MGREISIITGENETFRRVPKIHTNLVDQLMSVPHEEIKRREAELQETGRRESVQARATKTKAGSYPAFRRPRAKRKRLEGASGFLSSFAVSMRAFLLLCMLRALPPMKVFSFGSNCRLQLSAFLLGHWCTCFRISKKSLSVLFCTTTTLLLI